MSDGKVLTIEDILRAKAEYIKAFPKMDFKPYYSVQAPNMDTLIDTLAIRETLKYVENTPMESVCGFPIKLDKNMPADEVWIVGAAGEIRAKFKLGDLK